MNVIFDYELDGEVVISANLLEYGFARSGQTIAMCHNYIENRVQDKVIYWDDSGRSFIFVGIDKVFLSDYIHYNIYETINKIECGNKLGPNELILSLECCDRAKLRFIVNGNSRSCNGKNSFLNGVSLSQKGGNYTWHELSLRINRGEIKLKYSEPREDWEAMNYYSLVENKVDCLSDNPIKRGLYYAS